MSEITIVEYDPCWPQQFQRLKSIYINAFGDDNFCIAHVGSTAVPGLPAKPVLDIDIIVKDEAELLDSVVPVLESLGYQFVGDMGIKGRYAFKALSEFSPKNEDGSVSPKHHLYCCLEGSVSLTNHLLFRDALRNSAALAKEYGELKKRIALSATDIDVYVESKSLFIAEVLGQAGLSDDVIKDVIAQNRKTS